MRNNINIISVGRLGNCLFRYIKAVKICLENTSFDFDNTQNKYKSINERNLHFLKRKGNFTLNDYFQHEISNEEKIKIIEYIKNHPEHYVITDGNNNSVKGYHYQEQKYYIKDLMFEPDDFKNYYDLVFHVRLEDKVKSGIHIDYKFIFKVIDKIIEEDNIDYDNAAIVCLEPKTDFEKNYINNIKDYFKEKTNKELKFEKNNLIKDFHIMKNSKIVVCSLSTISWTACMFSDKLEKCYFPEWELGMSCFDHGSVSFRKPIQNTVTYNIK